MNVKTILAPVDFSPKSEAAAMHAAALARHFDAKLTLAYVLAGTPHEYLDFSEVAAQSREQAELERSRHIEGKLRALAMSVAPGEDVHRVTLEGDPAKRIIELATDADLVVLSTHGSGPWRRLLVGSVTAKILHDVECPVLTGSHLEETADFSELPYERVACAVGLHEGDHSERTLRWAWDFAQSYRAELIAIHVSSILDWQIEGRLAKEPAEAIVRAAKEDLAALVEKVGCQAELHCEGAMVRGYVSKIAAERHADALVIGRSVPHGLFGGPVTNAYELIRSAPCAVISV